MWLPTNLLRETAKSNGFPKRGRKEYRKPKRFWRSGKGCRMAYAWKGRYKVGWRIGSDWSYREYVADSWGQKRFLTDMIWPALHKPRDWLMDESSEFVVEPSRPLLEGIVGTWRGPLIRQTEQGIEVLDLGGIFLKDQA